MNCRGLRLELFRGLVIALAVPALAVAAAHAQASTDTTLSAGTLNGCALPVTIAVTAGGDPVTGIVTLQDTYTPSGYASQQVQLGSLALTSAGTVSSTIYLATGDHSLTASFAGTSSDEPSTSSPAVPVTISSQCVFMAAVSNFTPATTPVNALTPGQSGTATVSVVPDLAYAQTLTSTPMYVTLSCSGVPENATCNFTPRTVEISSATTGPVTSSMVIQTVAQSTASASPARRPGGGSPPIAWAFLLPGALGLGGLAWGSRRRRGPPGQILGRGAFSRWLSRLSLLALVGLVTLLGATACNPRYDYENHGPSPNSATPAGTYTLTVAAQSSNGITATYTTSFVLTVE